MSASRHRHGAALIIALIVLAALMLLGLPFLFSQSASVSGARRMEAATAARLYDDAAQGLGIALAEKSVAGRYAAGGTQSATSLTLVTNTGTWGTPTPFSTDTTTGWTTVGTAAVAPNLTRTGTSTDPALRADTGLAIADESFRLDANALGPREWQAVLSTAHIADWDDDTVSIDGYLAADYDADDIGQLAQGLVRRRIDRPYQRLEDLLGVEPSYAVNGQRPGVPHWPLMLRGPLNRSELELLRPLLTFSRRPNGRDGLVDVGSLAGRVIASRTYDIYDVPDDDGISSLIVDDAVVEGEQRTGGRLKGWVLYDNATAQEAQLHWMNATATPPDIDIGNGLFRRLASTVNLNALNRAAPGNLFAGLPDPGAGNHYDSIEQLMAALANPNTLAGTLQPSFSQGTRSHARPPIDLVGEPLFRIRSSSGVYDRADALSAQRRLEAVVQVVPDQGDLELRWETQGDLETTRAHRLSNRISTWPSALERQTIPLVSTATGTTGATPRTLPSEGDTKVDSSATPAQAAQNAQASSKSSIQQIDDPDLPAHPFFMPWMNVTWRAPFGRGVAQPNTETHFGTVLNGVTTGGIVDLVNLPTAADHFTPEGWTIDAGKGIAYQVGMGGPLVPRGQNAHEMAPTYLSFWFQPTEEWGSGYVTLAEMRSDPVHIGKPLLPTVLTAGGLPDAPSSGSVFRQNYLSLTYDADRKVIALTYASPAIDPPDTPSSWLIPLDAPGTPQSDERSDGGAGGRLFSARHDLLPRVGLAGQTTSFTYVGADGLQQGRWYRVTAAIGSGAVGGLAVHLDQCVGREVTSITGAYTPQVGDRCRWPALVLTDDLPVIARPLTAPDLPLLNSATVKVKPPAFVSAVLGVTATVDQFIPATGGVVLVDDEYIRYDGVSGWQLTPCRRGVRQNTQTDRSDPTKNIGPTYTDPEQLEWPTTQTHRAGALVLPGGFRATLNTQSSISAPTPVVHAGRLFAGGATLAEEFKPVSDPDWTGTPNDRLWAQVDTGANGSLSTSGALSVIASNLARWPGTGIVGIRNLSNGSAVYAYYVRISTTSLTLQPIALPDWTIRGTRVFASTTLNWVSGNIVIATSCGMRVGTVDPTEVVPHARYPYRTDLAASPPNVTPEEVAEQVASLEPQRFQLLAPATGAIEWVRYTHILHHASLGSFFVNIDGWGVGMTSGTTSRREQRTISRDWVTGALVIPVQQEHEAPAGIWLEPGDIATLIPKVYGSLPPIQVSIRYAATDGYGNPGGTAAIRSPNDTKNGLFAFSHFLPQTLLCSDYPEIIVGEGNSAPVNLTPQNPNFQPAAYLPRLDAGYADPSTSMAGGSLRAESGNADSGRLVLGGSDIARGGVPNGVAMRIDVPIAGTRNNDRIDPTGGNYGTGPTLTGASTNRVIGFFVGGSAALGISDSVTDLPAEIIVTSSAASPLTDEELGLIDLDGEVFAVECSSSPEARFDAWKAYLTASGMPDGTSYVAGAPNRVLRLIGRGLLGSTRAPHSLAANNLALIAQLSQKVPRYPGLPIDLVPFGPVRKIVDPTRLANAVTDTTTGYATKDRWFGLAQRTTAPGSFVPGWIPGPGMLAVRVDDPLLHEVIMPIGPFRLNPIGNTPAAYLNRYTSAPWLRGSYGTVAVDWSQAPPAGLNHLAIGWWPRYPSPLPPAATAPAAWESSIGRSRWSPWIGLPARLHGMRVGAQPTVTLDPARIHNIAAGAMLEVLAAGMAASIDGATTVPGTVENGGFSDWMAIYASQSATWNGNPLPSSPAGNALPADWCDGSKLVDGLELRIAWRLLATSTDLRETAHAGNVAPSISGARLTVRAPITTVSTDDAR